MNSDGKRDSPEMRTSSEAPLSSPLLPPLPHCRSQTGSSSHFLPLVNRDRTALMGSYK